MREREQMKTKEKTLLKLFDIIDLDQIVQDIDKDRENENVFECAVCEQIEKSKSQLLKHVREQHFSGDTSVYFCEECNYEATTKVDIQNHNIFSMYRM